MLRPGGRLVIYDFRFAPFEQTLADQARSAGLFTGAAPQRATIRSGLPLFPRLVRFTMVTAGDGA